MILFDTVAAKAKAQTKIKEMIDGRVEFRLLSKTKSGKYVFFERVFVKYDATVDENGDYRLLSDTASFETIYRLNEIPQK